MNLKKVKIKERLLEKLHEKLNETLKAVLPIIAIVLLLCFTIAPLEPGILLAFLLLRKTGSIRLFPLVKSLAAALVTGACLWFAAENVLTGTEGKLLLVVECGGMGILAAGLYALLLFLLRQEDFLALAGRFRSGRT